MGLPFRRLAMSIVAKRQTSAYRTTDKPSPYWLKIKNPRYSQAEGRDQFFNPQSDGITTNITRYV
jgi:hypothetical protein